MPLHFIGSLITGKFSQDLCLQLLSFLLLNSDRINRRNINNTYGNYFDSEGNPIPSQEGVEAIVNSIVFIGVDD